MHTDHKLKKSSK